jgi:hypothetical protein
MDSAARFVFRLRSHLVAVGHGSISIVAGKKALGTFLRGAVRMVLDRGCFWLRYVQESVPSFKGRAMKKKSVVAVLTVVSGLLLSSVPLLAQATQDANASPNIAIDTQIKLLREDVRSERKQLVAANLSLTDTEATKFWPIYDQYAAEVWKIGDARVALIKEYAQSYDTITDAQANDFMDRSAAIDQQFAALLTKYVPIFEKVISSKKTARLYQIDRRLDLLVNVQLFANIPMIDASK